MTRVAVRKRDTTRSDPDAVEMRQNVITVTGENTHIEGWKRLGGEKGEGERAMSKR